MKSIVFALLFAFVLVSAKPAEEEKMENLENQGLEELEREKKSVYGASAGYSAGGQAQSYGGAAKAPAKAQGGGYGQQQASYGQQQASYGQQQASYGQQQASYGQQQSSYGQQQGSYGQQQGGYAAPAKQSYAPAPAPVYSAPAPVYAPAVYSYQAPAPTVPCAKNVLVSCAPSLTPLPCSPQPAGQSYGY